MRELAALIMVGLTTSAALACPVCDSETGRQVRAGIFEESFGQHLLAILLPFPLLLAIVASVHFGFPWSRSTSAAGPHGRGG